MQNSVRKPKFLKLRTGDAIAVTGYKSFSNAVKEIATIEAAGPSFITLKDGRKYSARDGLGIGLASGTQIRHLDDLCDGIGRPPQTAHVGHDQPQPR